MPLPMTFETISNDPEWAEFSPITQAKMRQRWVQRRLARVTSGTPEQIENLKKQLIADAYRDAPEWQKPYQPKSLYPSAGEIPGEMWRLAGRLFTTPQQYLQAAFRQPADRPVLERVAEPFKHAFEYAIGEPKAVEKYPYTLYTDPMLASGALALGKYATKAVTKLPGVVAKQIPTIRKLAGRAEEALKGRIRPPGTQPIAGETAEAFNARMVAEEAAKREALKGRISEIKSAEETVGRPKPQIPAPRGPYNRAMPKLTPHYPREEARIVSEFVARHPDDVISKEILTGKISPATLSEIERRIFNRLPTSVPPVRPGVTPPIAGEPSIAEILNRPGGVADLMGKMGD